MILEDLKHKVIEFQKSGDALRLDVLRYLLAQVQNKEIELRAQQKPITDEDVFKLIRKQIKNRKEAIELYEKARRTDLLEKENTELGVYMEFAALFPFELNPVVPQQFQKK